MFPSLPFHDVATYPAHSRCLPSFPPLTTTLLHTAAPPLMPLVFTGFTSTPISGTNFPTQHPGCEFILLPEPLPQCIHPFSQIFLQCSTTHLPFLVDALDHLKSRMDWLVGDKKAPIFPPEFNTTNVVVSALNGSLPLLNTE